MGHNEAIGQRVRQLRTAAGMTQLDVARFVGVHQAAVSTWESGMLIPAPYRAQLARALGVTWEELDPSQLKTCDSCGHWLLDVDGVINALRVKTDLTGFPDVWPQDQWRNADVTDAFGRTYNITWAVPVVDFIRSVHLSGRAAVLWHTTWRPSVSMLEAALGLPTLPLAHAPEWDWTEEEKAQKWWKFPAAVRALVVDDIPLVWTDDDIGYDPQASATMRIFTKAQLGEGWVLPQVLPITPKSTDGLTPEHLRSIDEFLTKESPWG